MNSATQIETAETDALFPIVQDKRLGFIDQSGHVVLPPQFEVAGDDKFRAASSVTIRALREGLAPISIGQKVGYIDRTGVVVIDPDFEKGGLFREGFAPIKISGQWGYLDHRGSIVVNPQFEDVGLPGPSAVRFDDGTPLDPGFGFDFEGKRSQRSAANGAS
jgi:hypothetical protein